MNKSGGIKKNDFSKGPVWKSIIAQAVPLTIAQLVHLLYNIVDRIYLGNLGEGNSMALTGVGLTFPVVTLIMAFTALFAAAKGYYRGAADVIFAQNRIWCEGGAGGAYIQCDWWISMLCDYANDHLSEAGAKIR